MSIIACPSAVGSPFSNGTSIFSEGIIFTHRHPARIFFLSILSAFVAADTSFSDTVSLFFIQFSPMLSSSFLDVVRVLYKFLLVCAFPKIRIRSSVRYHCYFSLCISKALFLDWALHANAIKITHSLVLLLCDADTKPFARPMPAPLCLLITVCTFLYTLLAICLVQQAVHLSSCRMGRKEIRCT